MNNYSVSARDAIYSSAAEALQNTSKGPTLLQSAPQSTVIYPSKSSCSATSLKRHFLSYSCLTSSEPDTELWFWRRM